MKYNYIFTITFLISISSISSVYADDTLKLDTTLEHDFNNYYNFPKETELTLTGDHEMCPSNDCKMIFDRHVDAFIGTGITLNVENDQMTLNGYFKLTGSGEDKGIIGLLFRCEQSEVRENAESGTTKYICPKGSGSFLPEDESLGAYDYDYSASFELPSSHFIFNGTSTGTNGGNQHDCILFDC
jgi:hypothetical protein